MTRSGRPPFRAEHIGSLLRPQSLKDAFRAHAAGELDPVMLEETLDGAIINAIGLQEEAGMQAITDGEFRRGSWFLGFVEAIDGLTTAPSLFEFKGAHDSRSGGAWHCPFAERRVQRLAGVTTREFNFVRQHTERTPKASLPSPTAMHFWRGDEAVSKDAYPDIETYFADLPGSISRN